MTPQEAFQIAQPGFQAYAAGRLVDAEGVADQILASVPEDANGLYLKGIVRRARGDPHGALTHLRKVDEMVPGMLNIITAIGQTLGDLDMYVPAMACFDKAVSLHSKSAHAFLVRAELRQRLRFTDEAESDAKRALELEPDSLAARLTMARIAQMRGDTTAMKEYADIVLQAAPNLTEAKLLKARAFLKGGDPEEAIALLWDMAVDPRDAAVRGGLLGESYEVAGNYQTAFRAYEQGNQATRDLHTSRFEDGKGLNSLSQLKSVQNTLSSLTKAEAPEAAAAGTGLVFLVGFPRSGATLLEQMLAAHPEVITSDEHNCLGTVVAQVMAGEGGLKGFLQASEDQLDRLRAVYWRQVHELKGNVGGKIYVDKSPLNMSWMVVISRIFPAARILFMERDPRDAVFSAWVRPFGLNPAMYHMLSLDEAAEFFDVSNRLFEEGCRLMPLTAVKRVRYEILAEDPVAVSRDVLEFLDLPWDERVANFRDHLAGRAISTPSVNQVGQSVKARTVGRWRRYSEVMAGLRSHLDHWVRAWNYDDS